MGFLLIFAAPVVGQRGGEGVSLNIFFVCGNRVVDNWRKFPAPSHFRAVFLVEIKPEPAIFACFVIGHGFVIPWGCDMWTRKRLFNVHQDVRAYRPPEMRPFNELLFKDIRHGSAVLAIIRMFRVGLFTANHMICSPMSFTGLSRPGGGPTFRDGSISFEHPPCLCFRLERRGGQNPSCHDDRAFRWLCSCDRRSYPFVILLVNVCLFQGFDTRL
jgi:hypothetical protein